MPLFTVHAGKFQYNVSAKSLDEASEKAADANITLGHHGPHCDGYISAYNVFTTISTDFDGSLPKLFINPCGHGRYKVDEDRNKQTLSLIREQATNRLVDALVNEVESERNSEDAPQLGCLATPGIIYGDLCS